MAVPSLTNDPRRKTRAQQPAAPGNQAGPSTSTAHLNAGMQRLSMQGNKDNRLNPLHGNYTAMPTTTSTTSSSSKKPKDDSKTGNPFIDTLNKLPDWLKNPQKYLNKKQQNTLECYQNDKFKLEAYITSIFINATIGNITCILINKEGQFCLEKKQQVMFALPWNYLEQFSSAIQNAVDKNIMSQQVRNILNETAWTLTDYYKEMRGTDRKNKPLTSFRPKQTMSNLENFFNEVLSRNVQDPQTAGIKLLDMISTLITKGALQMTCNPDLITAGSNPLLTNASAKFLVASALDFTSVIHELSNIANINLPKLLSMFVDIYQRLYRILLGSELIKLNELLKKNGQVLPLNVDGIMLQAASSIVQSFKISYDSSETAFKKYVTELQNIKTNEAVIEQIKPENIEEKLLANLNNQLAGLNNVTIAIKLLSKIVDDKIHNQIPQNKKAQLQYISGLKESFNITDENSATYQPVLDLINTDLLKPVRTYNSNFLESKAQYGHLASWITILTGHQNKSIGDSAVSSKSGSWNLV